MKHGLSVRLLIISLIFADDHSRVILETISDNELTDFINANRVDVRTFVKFTLSAFNVKRG